MERSTKSKSNSGIVPLLVIGILIWLYSKNKKPDLLQMKIEPVDTIGIPPNEMYQKYEFPQPPEQSIPPNELYQIFRGRI